MGHHELKRLRGQPAAKRATWRQVAEEIGGCTPGMLSGLGKARHLSFPQAMRMVAWLGQPAARFTVLRVPRSPQPLPMERATGG
jgi:hypothetical protein